MGIWPPVDWVQIMPIFSIARNERSQKIDHIPLQQRLAFIQGNECCRMRGADRHLPILYPIPGEHIPDPIRNIKDFDPRGGSQ